MIVTIKKVKNCWSVIGSAEPYTTLVFFKSTNYFCHLTHIHALRHRKWYPRKMKKKMFHFFLWNSLLINIVIRNKKSFVFDRIGGTKPYNLVFLTRTHFCCRHKKTNSSVEKKQIITITQNVAQRGGLGSRFFFSQLLIHEKIYGWFFYECYNTRNTLEKTQYVNDYNKITKVYQKYKRWKINSSLRLVCVCVCDTGIYTLRHS